MVQYIFIALIFMYLIFRKSLPLENLNFYFDGNYRHSVTKQVQVHNKCGVATYYKQHQS